MNEPSLPFGNFMETIFLESPWPIWLMKPDGTLLDINASGEKILEIDKKDFVGKYNILQDKFLRSQGFHKLIEKVLKTGEAADGTINYRRYRGKKYDKCCQPGNDDALFLSGVIHPLFDNNRVLLLLVGQFVDRSREKTIQDRFRKEREHKLRRINALGSTFGTDYNSNIQEIYQTLMDLIPGLCIIYNTASHRSGSGILWYPRAEQKVNAQEILNFWAGYRKDKIHAGKNNSDLLLGELPQPLPGAIAEQNIGAFLHIPLSFSTTKGSLTVLAEKGQSFNDFEQHIFSTLAQYLVTQYQKRELFELLKQKQETLEKRNADIELIKILNEAGNTNKDFVNITISLFKSSLKKFSDFGYVFLEIDRLHRNVLLKKELVRTIAESRGIELTEKTHDISLSFDNIPGITDLIEKGRVRIVRKPELVRTYIELSNAQFADLTTAKRDLFPDIRELLVVPVISESSVIGILLVCEKERVRKTDEIRLRSIASSLSAIYEKFSSAEKLKRSEIKYRGLVEQSNDGIVIIQDQIIHFANAKMGDLLLLDSSKLIGMNILDFLAGKEREQLKEKLEKRVNGDFIPPIHEAVLIRTNGETLPVEINASLTQSINDKPAVLTIVRDIRERRRAEEIRVNLRIQEEKLKSLNIMATSIAHNFNNAMQTILGGMEIALDSIDPGSPAAEILRQSERSALAAAELGDLMLTYVGYRQGNFHNIHAAKLLESLSNDFQREHHLKGLELSISPDDLEIYGDEKQIRQAVMNILHNAYEAFEKDSDDKLIRIKCRKGLCHSNGIRYNFMESLPPKCCTISIFDNGGGIPKEHIEKIFDPYFTTRFTGRGIGLAVVQGVMRSHKGAIKINSEEGVGTEIKLYFPYNGKKDV